PSRPRPGERPRRCCAATAASTPVKRRPRPSRSGSSPPRSATCSMSADSRCTASDPTPGRLSSRTVTAPTSCGTTTAASATSTTSPTSRRADHVRTIDLRGRRLTAADMLAAVPRAASARAEALAAAVQIVEAVRTHGVTALREQAERFDHVTGHAIRVPAEHLAEAAASVDPEVRAALQAAIDRVRRGSAAQVPAAQTTEIEAGARITQRWQAVTRAGVYIPGGKAPLASSVVMNVVPAQVAGVTSIALASPPQAGHGGRVHPTILAAAALLGVDEVYAIGGAGAIGALAYGVAELGLDPVDVVSGPGNNYVASAK